MAPPSDAHCTQPQAQFAQSLGPRALRVRAPAKINLNLLVGPLGQDGYHPLDSLVAKIAFYDTIDLHLSDDDKIDLRCEGIDCGPADDNLALRAARLLAEQASRPLGARIVLSKRIPPGAGLGGGSSDAAAVLIGLDRLWELNLPDAALARLAAQLGSDVPLFLAPRASRMTGRGEHLSPISLPAFHLVLYLPQVHSSTREVYARFDRQEPMAWRRVDPADLALLPPSAWAQHLDNHLTQPALAASPPLQAAWDHFRAAIGRPVCMTGSGCGMFALCDDAIQAGQLLNRLPEPIARRCILARSNAW